MGEDLGLVIEKPILELLHITRDTDLEISTDGERLIIEPVRSEASKAEHRARVAAATKAVLAKHSVLLEKLAK